MHDNPSNRVETEEEKQKRRERDKARREAGNNQQKRKNRVETEAEKQKRRERDKIRRERMAVIKTCIDEENDDDSTFNDQLNSNTIREELLSASNKEKSTI